ncbi:MAG: VWFA-related protein [Acidobacteriaceae bacterium]|nr:VWFA-related protein [Acidobacteriaceae bacterium]
MKKLFAAGMLLWVQMGYSPLMGQTPAAPGEAAAPAAGQDSQVTTLTSRTTLVLVPTMVTTKGGEPVFTLQAKDFLVTDDGIEQAVTLEEDTGGEPLALVIVVETGSSGAQQLNKYRGIGTMLDSVVGGVPHKVAVVEFDSYAGVSQSFTSDLEKVNAAFQKMPEGDAGGAIFDAVGLAVEMLKTQPPTYRRAILLITETNDHGSKLKVADAVRAISDTNTAIYSMGFSSTRVQERHETEELLGSSEPGPPGGCMAKDPNEDPAAHKNVAVKGYDCLSLLAPPLRLAKMAAIAVRNALRQNVPETVAKVSGGEYFKFSDEKGLQRDLQRLSNHISNRYILSFHPQAPHVGFHTIGVTLREYKGVKLETRNGYWVDGDATAP